LATGRQYGNALLGVRHQEEEVFTHRHTGQFFLRGLSRLCQKIFSTVPEKVLC